MQIPAKQPVSVLMAQSCMENNVLNVIFHSVLTVIKRIAVGSVPTISFLVNILMKKPMSQPFPALVQMLLSPLTPPMIPVSAHLLLVLLKELASLVMLRIVWFAIKLIAARSATHLSTELLQVDPRSVLIPLFLVHAL